MKSEVNSHYLICSVLDKAFDQGQFIDSFQNTRRYLYKYAGLLLKKATTIYLDYKFTDGIKTKFEQKS